MTFLGEIRRRKVFQVATVYAVVAWILIQVVTAVEAPLNLPDWVDTLVIVLLAAGFPVALLLGWIFDITPDGITTTVAEPAASTKSGVPSGQQLTYVTHTLVLLAVGFLVVNEFVFDEPRGVAEQRTAIAGTGIVNRFEFKVPEDQALDAVRWGAIAISPDGRRFAYITDDGIYLRSMGSIEPRLIPGTDEAISGMTFAADGQSVFYGSEGGLKQASIDNGGPLPASVAGERQSWSLGLRRGVDNSVLYYENRVGIFRMTPGGPPELLIEVSTDFEAYGPQPLPGGDEILFAVAPRGPNTWDNGQIVVHRLSTGEQTVLVEHGSDPRYVETGHIVYGFGGALYGVAFDPATHAVSSSPVPLVQGVMTGGEGIDTPSHNFDISADGTLVYVAGSSPGRSRVTLVWVDRDGNEVPLGFEERIMAYPRLSPDGSRVAFATRGERNDVWVGDLARRTMSRLTVVAEGLSPVWSPDGSQLLYGYVRSLVSQAADGSTPPVTILPEDEGSPRWYPRSMSSDGSLLLLSSSEPPRDIGIFPIDGSAGARSLIATAGDEISPELSPDGRWLAYDSSESGRFEIYVRPFPDLDRGRIQVSVNGGRDPLFSREGDRLFYWVDPGTIMGVDIELDANGNLSAGIPRVVVRGDFVRENAARQYDISLDGDRFLVLRRAGRAGRLAASIMIVQNWVDELQRLVQ
jgi:hypothetical protein